MSMLTSINSGFEFIQNHLLLYQSTTFKDLKAEEIDQFEEDPISQTLQDDPVAIALQHSRSMVDFSSLENFTDETLLTHLKKSGLFVVVFYLEWDPVSITSVHVITSVVKQKSKQFPCTVGKMNCYDWSDICKKYNASQYPTIRIYRSNRQYIDYRGILEKNAIFQFLTLYYYPNPVLLKSTVEFPAFIAGNGPFEYLENRSRVLVINGVKELPKSEDEFAKAAREVHGQFPFARCVGSLANTTATLFKTSVPFLAVIRVTNDVTQEKRLLMNAKASVSDIIHFIKNESREAIFPELSLENYKIHQSFEKKRPAYLAVVLIQGSKHDYNRLRDTFKPTELSRNITDVAFFWLNNSNSYLGSRLIQYYKLDLQEKIHMVVINRKLQEVYIYKNQTWTDAAVTFWLKGVMSKKIQPTSKLNTKTWKPLQEDFDFNNQISKDDSLYFESLSGQTDLTNLQTPLKPLSFSAPKLRGSQKRLTYRDDGRKEYEDFYSKNAANIIGAMQKNEYHMASHNEL